jgi:hypothetical protein
MKNEKGVGTFLGIPYDWRTPTWSKLKSRWWNPSEPKIVVPRAFGWGYDFNFYRITHPLKKK